MDSGGARGIEMEGRVKGRRGFGGEAAPSAPPEEMSGLDTFVRKWKVGSDRMLED